MTPTDQNPTPQVLFVCTGNAARSVMGAALLAAKADAVRVASAGTHSIPGLAMSVRTRTVLDELGAPDPAHRSAQVEAADVEAADLVVIFEPMHLKWLRANLPQADGRAASLGRLCRDLSPDTRSGLADRVAALDLAGHEFEDWEEIVDPAGGDQEVFRRCGEEIAALIADLAVRIAGPGATPNLASPMDRPIGIDDDA